MSDHIQLNAEVPFSLSGTRLDQAVAELFPDYSRSRLQTWIKSGDLTVNGKSWRIRDKLSGGELVEIDTQLEVQDRWEAEDIALNIVYEDDDIIVVNKPTGLVVHPAAGHYSGTLLNALLHHCPQVSSVPRAGIVHRLDKDTTGLMVVAKTIEAQTELVAQLQDRSMGREYEAVVQGVMTGGGKVDEPMARHPKQRQKMSVHPTGKEAITNYRVLKKFRGHTHIRLKLETGRTHQIRVHMSHINHPLVGDPVYAGRFRQPKGITYDLQEQLRGFDRQALHAKRLEFFHPATGELVSWEVELPDDMKVLLLSMKRDASSLVEY